MIVTNESRQNELNHQKAIQGKIKYKCDQGSLIRFRSIGKFMIPMTIISEAFFK